MIRAAALSLFVVGLASLAARSADGPLPVAPQPREVRPDGSRDPAPQPEAPAKAEDPAVVVERIIKNSKDVGDKLAKTDTGADTRKTQDKILSDIDALINRQENPPPPKSNDNKDKNDQKNMDPMPNKDPKNNDPMQNSGMPEPKNGMPMDKMGMGNMQDGMPMGSGNSPQPMGRRPRMGDPMAGDKKDPAKNDQKPEPSNDKKGQPNDPKNDKGNTGKVAGSPGGKVGGKPSFPIDEDVAKEVWGHLPDKLRQQMTQYYKEDVMPKYSELLRLYYSSLSEKTANPSMPKK